MKSIIHFTCLIVVLVASVAFAQGDLKMHPSCPVCGMDRQQYGHSRVLVEYDDRTTLGACSVHCLAVEMAARREKTITGVQVADFFTKQLVPAARAYWVVGGNIPGVMTIRGKWAFGEKEEAEKFIRDHGGRQAGYTEVMKVVFEDMYEDLRMARERKKRMVMEADLKEHPECLLCGMDRQRYAGSRMYVRYETGKSTGTCSIHCAAIDLALHTDALATSVMVGDYRTKRLIDAEKAFWVIGGDKAGIMTIRGKWAFGEKEEAEKFIRENKGRLGTFDDAMKATLEDMYELLR
jgi:copper chaperone NosL